MSANNVIPAQHIRSTRGIQIVAKLATSRASLDTFPLLPAAFDYQLCFLSLATVEATLQDIGGVETGLQQRKRTYQVLQHTKFACKDLIWAVRLSEPRTPYEGMNCSALA